MNSYYEQSLYLGCDQFNKLKFKCSRCFRADFCPYDTLPETILLKIAWFWKWCGSQGKKTSFHFSSKSWISSDFNTKFNYKMCNYFLWKNENLATKIFLKTSRSCIFFTFLDSHVLIFFNITFFRKTSKIVNAKKGINIIKEHHPELDRRTLWSHVSWKW